jgi:peptidylprolyl isomerase
MSVISRRLALPILLPALAAALTVAGCSSTSGTSSGGKAEKAEAAAASSSAAAGSSTMPAVTNATDLTKKPTIGAGTPPPPTTLQTKDLVVGTGAAATASDTVSVRYVGANYADGKEFDSSWAQGTAPVQFALADVVPGFAQGIEGMKVGGRRQIVVPPSLGYGSQSNGPIVPNETLVFVVDLVKIG